MTGMADEGRTQSPYEWFLRRARQNVPRFRFSEGADFAQWKRECLPVVLATLGDLPAPVEPAAELVAEWEQDGMSCQRWLLQVQEDFAVTCHINRPSGIRDGARLPGILCWHGHTGFGKEPIMGNDSTPALREYISATNSDYGRRLAREGFVTFAIDWMGQGALDDHSKPHHRNLRPGLDWCDLYYLHATMLGITPLAINLRHAQVLLDFVCTLPFVDADRLGVMGESCGGTHALWTTLIDSRIRATEIICYSDLFADFGYRDANYCGSQVTPGLFALVDVPDLQGLIAPGPLLVDIGAYDECFKLESAMACHRRLRTIYAAAGADDMLELDLFPGGHAWGGSRSAAFFGRHLTAEATSENSMHGR
jgi:dienelactone hydrolase